MDRIAVRRELGAPLHHQIYLVLADGISTGRYGVGEVLPTEEQLTHMFSVSRITVRRAMESLHDAGLIERGAGRRTVVRPQIGRTMRVAMNSVIENIVAYGSETDARVIEFGYVEARGFVREHLWQAMEKPVQRAVRVRSHEGLPIMHLTSCVPAVLGETFTADDLGRISMFQLLARAGAHLSRGEQIVSATLADPTVASRLGIKVGAALIDMRRLMFDQKGRAVEYIEMLAIPDRMTMRMELGSDELAPAKAKRKSSRINRK
jgi:GntR family transcriptional regulator